MLLYLSIANVTQRNIIDTKISLNSGAQMPRIGLGTYQITDEGEIAETMRSALQAGYRLFDTAKLYDNEAAIGKAIAGSHVPRQELFITTKLWNDDQGYRTTLDAFEASLDRLGLDYVDLYLVHWPDEANTLQTWRAMEEIYSSGRAKSIGVSNFTITDLQTLLPQAQILPAVNQIQLQPFLYTKQKQLMKLCQELGIVIEAYSPLSHGVKLQDKSIVELAHKYHKTPAQILLRWSVQHDAVPIPKTSNPDRLIENIDIFDFEISTEDMGRLDELGNSIE